MKKMRRYNKMIDNFFSSILMKTVLYGCFYTLVTNLNLIFHLANLMAPDSRSKWCPKIRSQFESLYWKPGSEPKVMILFTDLNSLPIWCPTFRLMSKRDVFVSKGAWFNFKKIIDEKFVEIIIDCRERRAFDVDLFSW